MKFASKVKKTLFTIVSEISKHPELYAVHPGHDFTRSRKMDLAHLLLFLIGLGPDSIQQELLTYFGSDPNPMSDSGLFQQRSKLLPDVFPFLLNEFNSHFPVALLKGKYLPLACDGSTFAYPENPQDIESYDAPRENYEKGSNQVHVVSLFAIDSQRYVDAIIQPLHQQDEYRAICQMAGRMKISTIKPIFIADRGFQSFNVMAFMIEKGLYFVLRVRDNKFATILNVKGLPDKTLDFTSTIILCRTKSEKKYMHPELASQYRYLEKSVPFDFFSPDSHMEYAMTFRILRFKISETTYENIVTNLPSDDFPLEEIKHQYKDRWRIETEYRTLKYTIGALQFHSKKLNYVVQEIWAHIIFYNFSSVITQHVKLKETKSKYRQKPNTKIAFGQCRIFLIGTPAKGPPDIEMVIRNHTQPVKDGRNYKRNKKPKGSPNFQYR